MSTSLENHQIGLENLSVGAFKVDHLSLSRRPASSRINGNGAVRPFEFHTTGTDVGTASMAPGDGQIAEEFVKVLDEPEEDEDCEDDENLVWEFPKDVSLPDCATDPRDVGTADAWIKRNPLLVRLTGRHPFNCEPPLCRLMQHGFITPVSLHYVRNHGYVPRSAWEDWTVEICGLVKRPGKITMGQLVAEFEPRELPVTLVCAGNRRKEQNMVAQTIGFNWGAGGVSTSVWRGARLCDVLRRFGILSKKKGASHVCFEGAETLPGGGGTKYGTSVTVDMAMDPTRDVLLSYMQNGELLHPDHGFPVRMIIPGFIGGRMVKWLKRIVVTSQESQNYYHFHDNRVLPSHVDAEKANSEGWWYQPEYIINELNINSVITTPSHGEILAISSPKAPQSYTIRGYAYSGGGRKVTRVEVTFDGGETWNLCTVSHPEKPTKYGKHWCWCFWELDVEVMELVGAKEIAVRAWDESMNTQPKDLTWNVMGMMNNCWFRVKVNACNPQKGEIGLVFEHPTCPGNQSGGWMQEKDSRQRVNATLKKSLSTPVMRGSGEARRITVSEVQHHNSADSAWIIIHRHVYDCTKFLQDHPGGVDSILINAGSDCSEEFDAIHSAKAKAMIEDYRIGELVTDGQPDGSDPAHGSAPGSSLTRPTAMAPIDKVSFPRTGALNPKQNLPCKLIAKTIVSHDVRLFRFALPREDHVLGLPVGKHILLSAIINGKPCIRAYTPVCSDDEAVGFFDLLIKIYYKGIHPKFPAGGLMSQYLEGLPLGESVGVKGPLGQIQYEGRGNFTVNGKHRFAKKIAMMAGGTGITPLYQIIKAVLTDSQDETEMYLVYANKTEDDILLRDELDKWSERHSNFNVWYVISNSVREGWRYSLGFVNEEILRDHIPEGRSDNTVDGSTLALMCGPPPMIQFACLPNLAKMNYDTKNSCFQF